MGVLADLPAGVAGAEAVNANNAVLRKLLLGPATSTVVARRPRST